MGVNLYRRHMKHRNRIAYPVLPRIISIATRISRAGAVKNGIILVFVTERRDSGEKGKQPSINGPLIS